MPEYIENYQPDKTLIPGLGTNTPLTAPISTRGRKWLGELPYSPLVPKRGDCYFDTQLRKLLVYETRRYLYDKDKFAVDEWITGNTYKKGDYVISSTQLYICLNDHVSLAFPDPVNRKIESIIRRWVPLSGSTTTQVLGLPQFIPSGVWTEIVYGIFFGNRGDSMINLGKIEIDNPGEYLIIGYSNWINDENSIQRKSRILINGIEVQQATANSARITVNTTGTDSVGGAISATSDVVYGVETAQNNLTLIKNLVPGDVVTLEVRHNKGSDTDILQDSYLKVKQL